MPLTSSYPAPATRLALDGGWAHSGEWADRVLDPPHGAHEIPADTSPIHPCSPGPKRPNDSDKDAGGQLWDPGKAAAHSTGPGQRSEPQLDPEGKPKPPPLSPGKRAQGEGASSRAPDLGAGPMGRGDAQWVPSKDRARLKGTSRDSPNHRGASSPQTSPSPAWGRALRLGARSPRAPADGLQAGGAGPPQGRRFRGEGTPEQTWEGHGLRQTHTLTFSVYARTFKSQSLLRYGATDSHLHGSQISNPTGGVPSDQRLPGPPPSPPQPRSALGCCVRLLLGAPEREGYCAAFASGLTCLRTTRADGRVSFLVAASIFSREVC